MHSSNKICFFQQSAMELEELSYIMSGKTPKTPFCESPVYPYYVTFAAFFGQTEEGKRLPAIQRLAKGTETIQDQVSFSDRAFLLFVFATFCCNLPQPKMWYFGDKASNTIKKLAKWMKVEEANRALVQACNDEVKKHLGAIEADLDLAIADGSSSDGDNRDEDGSNAGSDSDIEN